MCADGPRLAAPLGPIVVLIECSHELTRGLVELALPLVETGLLAHAHMMAVTIRSVLRRAFVLGLELFRRVDRLVHHRETRNDWTSRLARVELHLLFPEDVRRAMELESFRWRIDTIPLVPLIWRGCHALPAKLRELGLVCIRFAYLMALSFVRGHWSLECAARHPFAVGGAVALLVVLENLGAISVDVTSGVGLWDLACLVARSLQPKGALRPDLSDWQLDGTLFARSPLPVQDGDRAQALAHPALLLLAVNKLGPLLHILLLHEFIIVHVLELLDRWLDAVGAVAGGKPCHLRVLQEIGRLFVDRAGQILRRQHRQLVLCFLWSLFAVLFGCLVLIVSA